MAVRPLKGPFTVDAFRRLAEARVLREDDRVELIDGQVVEMSPIGASHAACVRRLNRLLGRLLSDLAMVDVQNPIVLGARDQPQPDLTVLRPRVDAYRQHPRAADLLLVIEVSDTSLEYDRGTKVPLYARAGIAEVWIVDLDGDRIEVYRGPASGGYRDVRVVSRGETLSPSAFPDVTISVAEVLG